MNLPLRFAHVILNLGIVDFHPKGFNPAHVVSKLCALTSVFFCGWGDIAEKSPPKRRAKHSTLKITSSKIISCDFSPFSTPCARRTMRSPHDRTAATALLLLVLARGTGTAGVVTVTSVADVSRHCAYHAQLISLWPATYPRFGVAWYFGPPSAMPRATRPALPAGTWKRVAA